MLRQESFCEIEKQEADHDQGQNGAGGPALPFGRFQGLGREYLDRSVHDVRELRDELDLSVLGEVNRIKAA